MRPDEQELDDEIRGHLALAVQERIERGEDPEAARLAALRELGYVPAVRESMRRVWYSRWLDAASDLGRDMRVALRSLARAKGLSITVVVTLALGIGANAAIFGVVRGVLLRPLVNRDEDRLIYIRQSAPGLGTENLTFSVPEIADLRGRVETVGAFGDFSSLEFPLVGLGEPRVVRAGVVGGSFFEVMGLRPVLGRLLTPADDGPSAAGTAVLTHRFWATSLAADPSVIGTTIRLGSRTASIVGVLEPSVPYPVDTEVIANIVTSPHHLEATMVTGRTHRMTELFGRLAPGVSIDEARAELTAAHAAIMREHPEAYAANADVRIEVRRLRDQIATPARAILLVLLGAAGLVFLIACANVTNLILARSVHREGELSVRAALGASRGALRRTLLAEGLVLCGAGAVLGVLLARPLVALVARFAARFSVRALDVTVDGSLPFVGAGLAIAAAILLAYIPRLPASPHPDGAHPAGGGMRLTPSIGRRLKVFAVAQVACSFVLLSAAGALVGALVALQSRPTGLETRQVLAVDVPLPIEAFGRPSIAFYQEAIRRIRALPGVSHVAVTNVVPWRDAGTFGPFPFAVEGRATADGGDPPHAVLRNVTPGYFATLGIPIVAGRDFTDDDRGRDPVAIVSQSVAEQLFDSGDALNHRVWWTDPVFGATRLRIVGVVADVHDDDIHPRPTPAFAIYHPLWQIPFGGRLLVRTAGDPYALAPTVTRVIREIAPDQPAERAATLEDIRTEVLSPERVNAFIVSGFAAVALLIAVVGVAGVLAFSVSARTREFGVRLAVGSTPRDILVAVVKDGVGIVFLGVAAGALVGVAGARVVASWLDGVEMASAGAWLGAAALLIGAGIAGSLLPAMRAARVDVLRALRSE